MEKNWIITQSLNAYLYSCKYLNRNSYFYSYEAEKKKCGSYSNLYIVYYFLHFKFFARNIKNQIGTMIYFYKWLSVRLQTK